MPPYKKLLSCDVNKIKGGPQKVSMTRNLMNNMHIGARQLGFGDMVIIKYYSKAIIGFVQQNKAYNAI